MCRPPLVRPGAFERAQSGPAVREPAAHAGIAGGVFDWDLLSRGMERVATFLMATVFVLLVACVLVGGMLNLSVIAQKVSEAVDREPKA